MISHAEFGALRLVQFLPDAEIAALENWEYMDQVWLGEAVGFSEWLRLESESDVLRSLAIDFTDFPKQAAADVLEMIDLPIRPGMNLAALRETMGEPVRQIRFPTVEDRETYEFVVVGPPRYDVSCTVHREDGLTYLVVATTVPRRRR